MKIIVPDKEIIMQISEILVNHYKRQMNFVIIDPQIKMNIIRKNLEFIIKPKFDIKFDDFIKHIESLYDYEPGSIKSKIRDRHNDLCFVRWCCMWVYRTHYQNASTTKLGKIFGNRDHSAIIYALNEIDSLFQLVKNKTATVREYELYAIFLHIESEFKNFVK